jgi:hypothetical protein
MLKHACDGRLGLQDDSTRKAPHQRNVPNELQCVAESVTPANEHTLSVQRFYAPGGFLITSVQKKKIAFP